MPRPGAAGTGTNPLRWLMSGAHEVLAGGVLGAVVFQERFVGGEGGAAPWRVERLGAEKVQGGRQRDAGVEAVGYERHALTTD